MSNAINWGLERDLTDEEFQIVTESSVKQTSLFQITEI